MLSFSRALRRLAGALTHNGRFFRRLDDSVAADVAGKPQWCAAAAASAAAHEVSPGRAPLLACARSRRARSASRRLAFSIPARKWGI
jgi:hypothetical protein